MLVAEIRENFQIGMAERTKPELPPQGALIRLSGCGLCGSDLDKVVNQKALPGSVLGHEVVGVVEALAEGHHSAFQVGDRLATAHHVACGACHYCLNNSESMCREFKRSNLAPGGFAQHIALTRGHLHHTAFRVPDNISDAEASCMEPLACTLRAIERAETAQGGKFVNGSVAIVGLGFIGLMAAQVYRRKSYRVFGVDLLAERLTLAEREGFVDAARQPDELAHVLAEETELGRVDLVFLSVVNRHTLQFALESVRDGGTIVVFTSATGAETTIDPSALYFREINLITSYSPSRHDMKAAAEMIFNEQINLKPLLTHTMPLDRLNEAVALYQSGEAIKVFITP